ncbi:tryptophan--tRNA ligase [Legionella longbeachae]|uniref:Tryptophan--tRNA ligase n=1 Tax=Legionella longbeachae serogroup 1 (strain NSW150) TaxID=661367 RepID=D3HTB0_LEGLN|nr:tryptophan--tRNA ligase [Legionella longbeachae]VEE02643.1 tryptophanyl-tRNA synthetase [Legionella oakridgensis]HBD7397906.1 tryptophan--tRNA ligase [Legionella pneumophila]ARB91091.1 tryptophan--tRNA ligase [Legionella longbeachae]ARM32481.1 tryptophan--tRNA ligase [Legionella longbeachae]EEZ94706.1 tryptophanyl-tRNA synthetase [Legionella longbeachae D-4968]
MSVLFSSNKRVVSGMRVSGKLHLGHYHGVIKNWINLQHQYDCFFFAADWHGLTTQYDEPRFIEKHLWDMIVDWLACGVNPGLSRIFIQSWVPEHAELHLLLSMITPLGWLERVPTFKDQQEKLKEKDLATYGFLGYPLLQSADVLIYHADYVPVGEDQVSHIELTREIARRFNHLYGKEPNFEELAAEAIKKMGKKNSKFYSELRRQFQELGNHEAIKTAQALLEDQSNLSIGDKERLLGYLEGSGKIILPEPHPLLTETAKMPGLDGQKMSKSYHNTIMLREPPDQVEKKVLTMPTDPARVKRTDPGEPEKCPVWQFHKIYSTEEVKNWVQTGCRTAGIGCIECKRPVVDSINKELKPIQEAITEYESDLGSVKRIVSEGSESAREVACKNLSTVREVMGLDY